LLLVDLHPPTGRDPDGIHGSIWAEIMDDPYRRPPDKPLTAASYAVDEGAVTAYVEPLAVGDSLPEMPLFLSGRLHVSVPLEETYQAAWQGVPQRWRGLLEEGGLP